MTDQSQIQAAVSARISSEFGQNRLMLLEAQVVNDVLQAALEASQSQLTTLQTKFDTISAENLTLHAQLGTAPPQPQGD